MWGCVLYRSFQQLCFFLEVLLQRVPHIFVQVEDQWSSLLFHFHELRSHCLHSHCFHLLPYLLQSRILNGFILIAFIRWLTRCLHLFSTEIKKRRLGSWRTIHDCWLSCCLHLILWLLLQGSLKCSMQLTMAIFLQIRLLIMAVLLLLRLLIRLLIRLPSFTKLQKSICSQILTQFYWMYQEHPLNILSPNSQPMILEKLYSQLGRLNKTTSRNCSKILAKNLAPGN